MNSTEVKCVCGARLRIVTEPGPGKDSSQHRYRCPRCGVVTPTADSIVEVSRFDAGEWQTLGPSDWADETRPR